MSKQSDAELLIALAQCPPAGARFRHYKGNEYEVLGSCILEVTKDPCVLYRPVGGQVVWCRPLANWQEMVAVDGGTVRRFERIL